MPIKDTPQLNKQHAVPQNIMEVEFKLIGDLTMRQFTYLFVFLGVAYGIFRSGLPIVLRLPTTLILSLLGIGFAFVPIEDRGLDEWLINFFKAVYSINELIWRKKPTPPSAFVYKNLSMVQQELITLAPTASRRKLKRYLDQETTDSYQDPFDKKEMQYIQKVQDYFQDIQPQQEVEVSTLEPTKPTEHETQIGTIDEQPGKDISEQPKEQEKIEKKEIKQPEPKPKKKPSLKLPKEIYLGSITPDRHTGRMFTNLVPDEGTIILPIRGEKVIEPETVDEVPTDENINKKAEQLKRFIQQIESQKPEKKTKSVEKEGDELIKQLEKKKTDLVVKIQILEEEMEDIKDPKKKKQKQNQITTLKDEETQIKENIEELKQQLSSLEKIEVIPEDPTEEKIPDYLNPEIPNVIAGVVKNIRGRNLEGILLVIKNDKGDPIRAMKTNSLGEFSITNPLSDGKYTMEIDVNNSSGFNFDIIDFEANGKIIPPMKLVGK